MGQPTRARTEEEQSSMRGGAVSQDACETVSEPSSRTCMGSLRANGWPSAEAAQTPNEPPGKLAGTPHEESQRPSAHAAFPFCRITARRAASERPPLHAEPGLEEYYPGTYAPQKPSGAGE